MANNAIIMLII